MTEFAVGSLVRARGREWVVLPESAAESELLVLRPLGGSEDQVTGIYLPLEPVAPAAFPLPDPARGSRSAEDGPARRASVVHTAAVNLRTTLLLLRLRFHLVTRGRDGQEKPLLAEDLAVVGFRGSPERAEWLPAADLEPLLAAEPGKNIPPEIARRQLESILVGLPGLHPHLDRVATERGEELLAAHRRVRQAARQTVRALRVEPHLPADVLGVFVYLPVPI